MMTTTKAGEAFIKEYLSERNEALENEKRRLTWMSVWYGIGGFKRAIAKCLSFYFVNWLFLGVCVALMFGYADFPIEGEITYEDIKSSLRTMHFIVLVFTSMTIVVFLALHAHGMFRNAKDEWVEAENKAASELACNVEIIEEILRRHELIDAEAEI